jgi:hypothetical protein
MLRLPNHEAFANHCSHLFYTKTIMLLYSKGSGTTDNWTLYLFFYRSIQRDLDDEVSTIKYTAGSFICRVWRNELKRGSFCYSRNRWHRRCISENWGLPTNLMTVQRLHTHTQKKKEMPVCWWAPLFSNERSIFHLHTNVTRSNMQYVELIGSWTSWIYLVNPRTK